MHIMASLFPCFSSQAFIACSMKSGEGTMTPQAFIACSMKSREGTMTPQAFIACSMKSGEGTVTPQALIYCLKYEIGGGDRDSPGFNLLLEV